MIASASEARLRGLIELAPDGIFVTREGNIVYVNRAGVAMLGLDAPRDVVDLPLAELLTPHALAAGAERLGSVQPDRLLPVRIYDVRRRDGQIVTIEATSIAIEWDGAPAALTFGRDITERLRMEQALSRADRLTALGALAAGVAHEINNPLAFVSLGFDRLEQLVLALPDDRVSEALSVLADMREGIGRVAAITRDLRTFARDRDEADGGSTDLASALASVERLVSHQLKHHTNLVIEVPSDLPPVRVASLRLEQVFVNLLVNAAEALDTTAGSIVVRARQHGSDRVIIEVVDNGPGIAPAVRARMFEPFFTTKGATTGTGLGLAISQTIVTDAGGELTVESELGKGTTFRIVLPVAASRPELAPVEPARRSTRRARTLIVDDEPAIADSLGALIATSHDVEIMTSSRDALARLLGGATYDVILCDLMMPQVTGMDLYDQLARARPGEERKLVFMTGGAFTARAHGFLARIPNRHLEKPFAIGELEAIISDVLAR